MKLDAGCEILFEAIAPTPLILMLRPSSGLAQWVFHEEYVIEPNVPVVEYTDSYGNLCQRLVAPQGAFRIRASASVVTADRIDVQAGAPFVPV